MATQQTTAAEQQGNDAGITPQYPKGSEEDIAARMDALLYSDDDDDDEAEDEQSATPADSGESEDDDEGTETESDDEVKASEEDDEEGADEGDPIRSIDELAEAFGMPLEDLQQQLQVKVKINGQEREVTLGELQAGYQKGEAFDERKAALQRERQEFEQEATKVVDHYRSQLLDAGRLIQMNMQALTGSLNSPEMQQLKAQNPGQYAARALEIQQRQQYLQQMMQQQADAYAQVNAEQQNKQRQQMEQYLSEQAGLLEQKLPNLNRDELVDYLTTQGVDDSIMGKFTEHQLVILAHKAMLYDKVQSQARPAAKKVRDLPKFAKPGKRQQPKSASRKQAEQLRSRFKRSGSVDDMAALLDHQMKS